MEANRKMRKGFMKGKLVMSLNRATKPSSTLAQPYTTNSKVMKPSYSPLFVTQEHQVIIPPSKQKITSSTSSASVGFIVNQEKKANPQPKQKVSYVIPENTYGKFENSYYGVIADETVDARAASYISCVQERFKLERVNSERELATSLL